MPSGTGTARADSVCASLYESVVDGGHRNRIQEERGEPAHRALLASSSLLPQGFEIENKERREIQRPNEDVIANTYPDFFRAGTPVSKSVIDTEIRVDWLNSGRKRFCNFHQWYLHGLDGDHRKHSFW